MPGHQNPHSNLAFGASPLLHILPRIGGGTRLGEHQRETPGNVITDVFYYCLERNDFLNLPNERSHLIF